MVRKYNFKVLRYSLFFEDLPEAFEGYQITQISDIHSGRFDNKNKISYAVDLINQQDSDAIFFTGDLVNNVADEMDDWKERGILDKHDLAWSRDGSEKVYVQHLMRKNGLEIWEWIDGGVYFYVCGDKSRMAKDVHQTLIDICSEHGKMSLLVEE